MLDDKIKEILQACPRWIVSNDSQVPDRPTSAGQYIVFSQNSPYLKGGLDETTLGYEPGKNDGNFRLESDGQIVTRDVQVQNQFGYPLVSLPGENKHLLDPDCPPIFLAGAITSEHRQVTPGDFASLEGKAHLRKLGLEDKAASYLMAWFSHGRDDSGRRAYARMCAVLPQDRDVIPWTRQDDMEVLSTLFPKTIVNHFQDKLCVPEKIIGGYHIRL